MVWQSDLEPPIIMSANSTWWAGLILPAGSSRQELLTIDSDSPWEVLQAGRVGGGVTETQCLWTANNNVRQLDIAEQTPN